MQVVVDAVEKACRNEPQFAKSLEACCPDCLEVLQRQVLTRLKAAMEGSDIKLLQDLLALGHGINLPPGILKEAKVLGHASTRLSLCCNTSKACSQLSRLQNAT